jgi:hypothetical protein
MNKDVKPIFDWAKTNGDANIYDRILMKVMPQLLKENIKITSNSIKESSTIEVSSELYDLIKDKAQELINKNFDK